MNRILLILTVLLLSYSHGVSGQDKFSMDGYISDMQTFYTMEDRWLWENTFMDRFNFKVYPSSWLSGSIQIRSRIITGSTLRKIPGYTEVLRQDPGLVDMTFLSSGNLGDSAGFALASTIDRLWLQFTFGNLEITAGRQRINWGQTIVWNPNDIFNSYSYFEVDYPERPGSDALRLQYYTGNASSLELAAKLDSARRVTTAAYFRFNTLGYDIQLIGGVYQEEDLVLGTGWSGNLGPTAFRGELSYFRALNQFSDTTGYLMASTGFDYTFSNSLWIQVEGLYSAFAKEMDLNSFLQFYGSNMDVKSLGFTDWSFFTSLSFPFTPLFTGSFAGIWYPEWKGFYLGPSLDVSLNNNMELSLIFQHFTARFNKASGSSSREKNTFGFLRFKWSF